MYQSVVLGTKKCRQTARDGSSGAQGAGCSQFVDAKTGPLGAFVKGRRAELEPVHRQAGQVDERHNTERKSIEALTVYRHSERKCSDCGQYHQKFQTIRFALANAMEMQP